MVWLSLWIPVGCFYVTERELEERLDLDGDGVPRPIDCDDGDRSVSEARIFFADRDADGLGDPLDTTAACHPPAGFVATSGDCDDGDSAALPGAPEVCDGIDNDCDGAVDEGLSVQRWHPDADGDGAGDAARSVQACGRPEGHVATGDDCDDTDPATFPGADEVCNGVDDDCDGAVDEQDPSVLLLAWHLDADLDGYGATETRSMSCEAPATGWVLADGDCADHDPWIHPGAEEVCNGVDDDCDATIDQGAVDATRYFVDADGDGFGDALLPVDLCPMPTHTGDTGWSGACELPPPGHSCSPSDCDDGDPDAFPGADEICSDGADDDCDGAIDERPCVAR